MNKFIITLILLLGCSFAANNTSEADKYYASLNTDSEVILAAYHKKEDKSPLRKRYLRRKRKVRNPAQGK